MILQKAAHTFSAMCVIKMAVIVTAMLHAPITVPLPDLYDTVTTATGRERAR